MRLLVILIFFSFRTSAQEIYYVSHVEGVVRKATEKKALTVGQALILKDSLVFKTHHDYVCLESPVKGSRIARYETDAYPGKVSEFIKCVKDILVPSVTVIATASREGMINSLFDFENYLNTYADPNTPLLIIDSSVISLGATFAANPEQHFFYAKCFLINQTINKKLSFRSSMPNGSIQIILNDSIFRLDGKLIDQTKIDSVQIFYYDSQKEQSFYVNTIRIKVVQTKTIVEELCVIKKHFLSLQRGNEEVFKDALYSHLTANYGKVDKQSFERICNILSASSCE